MNGAAIIFDKTNNGVFPDAEIEFTYTTEAECRKGIREAFTARFGYKPKSVRRIVKGVGVKFEAVGPTDDWYRKDVAFGWV